MCAWGGWGTEDLCLQTYPPPDNTYALLDTLEKKSQWLLLIFHLGNGKKPRHLSKILIFAFDNFNPSPPPNNKKKAKALYYTDGKRMDIKFCIPI